MKEIALIPVSKKDERMTANMQVHYSQPKGFVGRSICYAIYCDGSYYGTIAGGSATRHLPNREIVQSLNNGVNNIFFHIEKANGKYPMRWFSASVLKEYRKSIETDWKQKYGDDVLWHETLVELPRTGDCYKKDGWKLVGQTKGFTCKRIAGNGTDSWTGKRVWDTENLRPKLVFVKPSNKSLLIS